MSGEVELSAGYVFAEGEILTIAKLRAAVEGLVARVAAGVITERELADGSISLDKLAADVVGSVVIPDGAVTSDKISNAAVTPAKIASDAVDRTKLASNVVGTGLVQNGDGSLSPVADDATLEIHNGALRIKPGGVSALQLADGAVTHEKLGTTVVDTDNIVGDLETPGAVTADKLAASCVTLAKLAASALGQVRYDASSMALECTASTDATWKSWAVTGRTPDAGSFLVLVLAEVEYAGSAPAVTFKLFDGATEKISQAVMAGDSGAQAVAALLYTPLGSNGTLTLKVNASEDCDMGAESRILWMEWPNK